MSASDTILELRDIRKYFPGVKALDGVRFDLRGGEIHALMGENGAGKSTFIKIITGVYRPEGGELRLDGEAVELDGPKDAQRRGIAAIYQHVTCFPDLSVGENIFMGHEPVKGPAGAVDWRLMHKRAAELLESLDANFDSRAAMGTLSVAQQQIVEIAKALSANARIIIMDEPTAALSNRESEDLYRIADGLRAKGVSIIFITHRFEDMRRLADRVTVFRDGRYIDTWDKDALDTELLVQAMVGREIVQFFPPRQAAVGEEALRVEGFTRTGFFRDVSFEVRRGEVVALTGLVGAGRTELCESLFGISPHDGGKVVLAGENFVPRDPADSLARGLGYLPEDRLRQGLVLDWEIAKNVTLPALREYARWGWLDTGKERGAAKELAEKLGVKAVSVTDKVSTLSGGNQQKVIVAKLLVSDLHVIILDEPTKGVDVGAKTAIYGIMNDLAAQGYGILMVSSEMPEVMGMSDRIVVMREGRVSAVMETKGASQTDILNAAMAAGDGE